MKSILGFTVVTFFVFSLGCNSDNHTGADSGGASGTAGTQSAPDSGAGNGGASSGSGGNSTAGSGGSGGVAGSDVPIDTSSVDLTLGGFNQDLPAPSVNCMERSDFSVGCISVSGVVDGVSFDHYCAEGNTTIGGSAYDSPSGRVYGESMYCTTDESDWCAGVNTPDLSVGLGKRSFVFDKTFLPGDNWLSGVTFYWQDKAASTSDDNFVKSQMAGWNKVISKGPLSWQTREVQGVFAATWTKPDPSKCATSQIEGCLEVRLRGTFHGFY
jgi:hypothetical protein